MAEVNNREFGREVLRAVFRTLDGGGTRDDVRRVVKLQQGRGVSNDTIRALRELHRRLRRSQGYNVKVGGKRDLIDPNTGQLRRLSKLPARKKVAPSRKPAPPRIEGVRVTAEYVAVDNRGRPTGRKVGVFRVTEGGPSLAEQVSRASVEDTGTFVPGPVGAVRSTRILQVRSDL